MWRVLGCLLCFARLGVLQREDEVPSSLLKAEHRGDSCDCMEYWTCVISGGSPYSYCGLSESSVCCVIPENATPITSFVTSQPLPKGKSRCGVKGFDSGQDGYAEPSEWPWHVAIVEEPGFFYVCGGTLIDEYWVLTAAHCLGEYGGSPSKLKVRLGEYDVSTTSENLAHEDRAVESLVLHPAFDNETLANDIALVKLKQKATQRPHVDVVCLANQDARFGPTSRCVITGWGRRSPESTFSNVLKEISLPLWESEKCEDALKKEFGADYKLQNSTFCAGQIGQDACDGDGGGPLVCLREGQWFQVGVISFGIGCGQKDTPGVYTNVRQFEKWIRQTVLFSKIKL